MLFGGIFAEICDFITQIAYFSGDFYKKILFYVLNHGDVMQIFPVLLLSDSGIT